MPSFTKQVQLTAMSSTNILINGDQALSVQPTANSAITTLTSASVMGTTVSSTEREFLVNFGLTSNTGSTAGGNNGDKVTLYSGLQTAVGSGNVWSVYSDMIIAPNSGGLTSQGYELDLDNLNANRGNNGALGTDFGGAVSIGISLTGASDHSNTTAMLISSQSGHSAPQWNRGISLVGTIGFCGYQDWTTAPVAIQFDGTYSVAAINLTGLYGNPGCSTPTGLFLANNQSIAWQNSNISNPPISLKNDNFNNLILGAGCAGILAGNILAPLTPGTDLGTTTNYWGRIWSIIGVQSPSDLSLKDDVIAMPAVANTIKAVTPIQYSYKNDPEGRRHCGFNAAEIKSAFGEGFAGYAEEDGLQYLVREELIGVLWQANKELLARVEKLEAVASRAAAMLHTH